MNLAKRELTRKLGVDALTAERLMQAGMTSYGALHEATDEEIGALTGLGPGEIRSLRQRAEPEEVILNLKDK